ncbi:hypothetical protein Tco_0408248 [Tanacetum coccineum]
MANLDFCDKHNMVAYLQKSEGSEEQFWQTATACTLENEDMEITATIDGKVKIVSESSIRRHLKLEDYDGLSTLPSIKIFEQLALMGFIQIFLNKQKRLLLPHQRTYIAPSLTQKLFSNMKRASKGYTGVDTPLFQTMLVQGQILQGEGSTNPVESHHTPTVAPSTSQPHHSPTLRDFIKHETEVPQLSSPTQTHVADKAASTVHTLGSDEGRMQPNELMELVTKFLDRVAILKNDLKQTKKPYGAAFTKLIKKVKTLEKTIKSSKARRRAQFVVSDDEAEDSFNQGRKIAEIDKDPDISLFTTPEEVYTAESNISTANVPVSTAGAEVSTAAESLVYIRRSVAKRKDKGKAIVEESKPTQTKTKIQQEQERLGFKEAQRLQEQFDEEKRQRIASVHKEAKLINERKRQFTQQRAQQRKNKPLIQAQQRSYMCNYIKHIGSHTLQQLRGYSFDEIKVLFEATVKKVNTFTPMESDDTVPKVIVGSSKRSAEEELSEESSKRQKIGEGSEPAEESKDKESDELSQEQLQQLIIIVPEEAMNVEALQTKYPIIDWEIYTEDLRKYWKIIRVGDHTEVYQFFEDMLKNFDRDDLVKLWDLVREIFSLTEPTDDKERVLWVELKRLFEPDTDDLLELQRYMHDPLTWRLYDTCGLHHVFTET